MWINRNRSLGNGQDRIFSIPLKKDSECLDVRDREVSDAFDRTKLLNRFAGAYAKALHFERAFAEVRNIVSCGDTNLFKFILNSVVRVASIRFCITATSGR